jgi:hypothetical protein
MNELLTMKEQFLEFSNQIQNKLKEYNLILTYMNLDFSYSHLFKEFNYQVEVNGMYKEVDVIEFELMADTLEELLKMSFEEIDNHFPESILIDYQIDK